MSIDELDRTKPFGTVIPPENNAHFWQAGFYYNVEGKLIHEMMDDTARAKLRSVEADAQAARAAIAARNEYLRSQGVLTPETQAPPHIPVTAPLTGEEADDPPADAIDFQGWLRGEKNYHWQSVRSAVRLKYNRECANVDAIRDFLVDDMGLVPREDVRI